MAGLLQSLKPTKQQPQQSAVAVVPPVVVIPVSVIPPPAVRTTTDCPHRQTRIIAIVPPEAFDFDATEKHNLTIDRSNEDWWERFEECLWCGEWLEIIEESEESTEETKPSAVACFEW